MRGSLALYAAQANAQIDAEMAEQGACGQKLTGPAGNSGWAASPFLIWQPAIFRHIKEIKQLRGGVVLYAAQANAQIDAEMAEQGGLRTETNYAPST